MDVILQVLDPLALDKVYAWALPAPLAGTSSLHNASHHEHAAAPPLQLDLSSNGSSLWARDNIYRQITSILILTQLGATSLYFVFSALSYYCLYDRRLEYHPRFLQNQVRQEIASSMRAVPVINILTLPWFLAEARGQSLLYHDVREHYGWPFLLLSAVFYMAWNDIAIYWIHRLEHHPSVYKYIHKPHHKWIIPTPWAALAFHPLDGYVQSLPYHVFPFIFPIQRHLYLALFVAVQIWTIFIHDGDMISGHWTEKFINSPAHHTLHHMYFTVNYGQYFTWADTYFGSHRAPQPELDPLHDALKVMRAKGLVDANGNLLKPSKVE